MTTHANVDPFNPNFGNALPTHSVPADLNSLQNFMKMKIMNSIIHGMGTGNQIVDSIIMTLLQCLVFGAVGFFMSWFGRLASNLTLLPSQFGSLIMNTWTFVRTFTQYQVLGKKRLIHKRVDIPYISDTRQINGLYTAVFWYLTHTEKIDFLQEPYLQFVYEKQLKAHTKPDGIHKILSQNKTKSIMYNNHEITYYLTMEKITIHADKDRVRENHKVILSTMVPEGTTTDILDEFSQHCLVKYIDSLESSTWSQKIYTNQGNASWQSTASKNTRKLETVILKNGLNDLIRKDIQLFLDSENWYKDRDIPYTRGYLFYGQPGTGKTSMIKGISTFCQRHIHYLILSSVKSDAELLDLLSKVEYDKTILVIEDIDATVKAVHQRGTEVVKEKLEDQKENLTGITLSGLLNAIDGIFSCHGRILIMTSNHPEVLDTALIRPGRIDGKYLFDNCSKEQIADIYRMFFGMEADSSQLAKIQDGNYSPAHLTAVFQRYRSNPGEALSHIDDDEMKLK